MVKKLSAVGALFICAAAVFEIIEKVAIPGHTYFWREIHNLGHTPLFGVVAVVILQLSKLFFDLPEERYPRHYIVAFIIASGMGSRAQSLFQQNRIAVIIGAMETDPEKAVLSYLSGQLATSENICDH